MKNLTLDLETLAVDTFATNDIGPVFGGSSCDPTNTGCCG